MILFVLACCDALFPPAAESRDGVDVVILRTICSSLGSTEEEEDEFDYDGVVAWIEGTPEAKKKPEEKHATPEVANAQKKRTGGRRSLFASK